MVVGGGQCPYCLVSIGSQSRITVAVLVNHCLTEQQSGRLLTALICCVAESDQALKMGEEKKEKNGTKPPLGRRDTLRDCSLNKTPDLTWDATRKRKKKSNSLINRIYIYIKYTNSKK